MFRLDHTSSTKSVALFKTMALREPLSKLLITKLGNWKPKVSEILIKIRETENWNLRHE